MNPEKEFERRRNMPNVEIRRTISKRTQTIELYHHQLGEIGSMVMTYSRGKLVSTYYVLNGKV